MNRLILLLVCLVALLCVASAQRYDGLVYGRSNQRFNIEAGGYAHLIRDGDAFRGQFVCNDPWYAFNSLHAWPVGNSYRFEWWHLQFPSFGHAEGWFTVQIINGRMVWDMWVMSDYYGFPDHLVVVLTAS